MIGLTTLFRLAISRKYLAFNPSSGYKYQKAQRQRLSVTERVGTARNVQLRKNKDELVKDLFVFSCFTGLSYSDMKDRRSSNIQDFFDGNQWIIVRRKKTATSSNVMLLDIAKMIIEKYTGLSKGGKVFPIPSNTICNDSSTFHKACQYTQGLTFFIASYFRC